jgi:dephospho-CoA kinase
MLRIGLTGGIASGKSAVAAMLREKGFCVLDADSLAHKLIEVGQPAHTEVLAAFGTAVGGENGSIDRAKLGAIVFADSEKLKLLNAIVHPRVREAILSQFYEWERGGVRDAAFVEAALLVEAGFTKDLNGLVVAWSTPEQQLQRLLARGLTEAEAKRRIAAQLPVAIKLREATERIDCSGSLEQTRTQVEALAAKLRNNARQSQSGDARQ